MKIEGTCGTCGRRFLLAQIGLDSDAPGRCPFCGARFARHYNTLLVETVDEVERAASDFINALNRLQDMEKGFVIEHDELVADITGTIREHDQDLPA